MGITLSREEFENKYGTQPSTQKVTLSKEEFNKKYNQEDKSVLRQVAEVGPEVKEGVFGKLKESGTKIKEAFSSFNIPFTKKDDEKRAAEGIETQGIFETGGQIGAEIVEGGIDTVFEVLKGLGKSADIYSGGRLKKAVEPGFDAFMEDIKEFAELAPEGLLSNLRTEKPELADKLESEAIRIKDELKNNKRWQRNLTVLEAGVDIAGLGAGKVAKEGLEEAVGTGIEKGLKTATGIGEDVVGGVTKLAGETRDIVATKLDEKLLSISNELMKRSPTQTRNELKWNKNTPQFLVDEGVVGMIDTDGKKIVTDKAVSALREKYFAESRAFNNLLTDSGEYVSLNDFKAKSIASIDDKFKARGTDYKKAIKQIEDEIDAYKDNFRKNGLIEGDDLHVNISDFNKIKTGLWSKTSNFNPSQSDKLLSDVSYRMGQTAKTLIEDSVEDVAVKRMNSRLGDFASAIDILEKAQGKVLPGGFFGKAFTRLSGTVVGSGAGVPGSIIGNLTGGMLANVMSNPKYKTKALQDFIKLIKKKKPEAQSLIDEANAILIKRGEDRKARLLLGEGTTINVGPKTDTSGILSQEEALSTLKETGTVK